MSDQSPAPTPMSVEQALQRIGGAVMTGGVFDTLPGQYTALSQSMIDALILAVRAESGELQLRLGERIVTWQARAEQAEAALSRLQVERDELCEAVWPGHPTDHKAIVALAEAHRQDSQRVDELEAERDELTKYPRVDVDAFSERIGCDLDHYAGKLAKKALRACQIGKQPLDEVRGSAESAKAK